MQSFNTTYLARLHGYVSGDGSAGFYSYPYKKDKPHLNIKIDDPACLDKILEAFAAFGYSPSVSRNWGSGGQWFTVQAQKRKIIHKILSLGQVGSYRWRIPNLKNRQCLREWVAAFFDSEATVASPNREIVIESVNPIGLNQLKRVLDDFDVFPHLGFREGRNVYLLRICGRKDLENFHSNIGFNHSKKNGRLQSLLSSYQKYYGGSWKPPEVKSRKTARNFLADLFAHRGYFRTKAQRYGSFEIGLHNPEAMAKVAALLQNYFDIHGAVSVTQDKQGRSWLWISQVRELKKIVVSGLLRKAPRKEDAVRAFLLGSNSMKLGPKVHNGNIPNQKIISTGSTC